MPPARSNGGKGSPNALIRNQIGSSFSAINRSPGDLVLPGKNRSPLRRQISFQSQGSSCHGSVEGTGEVSTQIVGSGRIHQCDSEKLVIECHSRTSWIRECSVRSTMCSRLF